MPQPCPISKKWMEVKGKAVVGRIPATSRTCPAWREAAKSGTVFGQTWQAGNPKITLF